MAKRDDAEFARQKKTRADASDRVVGSTAAKRLIVAGPGTGKSFTFRRAFSQVGDSGLALTFIRALERELRAALPTSVQVNTFHGYCVHLFRLFHGSDPFMYPPLFDLVATDLTLQGRTTSWSDIDAAFFDVDDSKGLLTAAIARADYYGAVSYNDIVYRVLRSLQAEPQRIEKFPLIVVDEYQDFNRLETAFIDVLATANQLLVAGDDDQALYKLKRASPDYLRTIATDGSYQRFELPFCSRCTEVVVLAIHDVLLEAQKRGLLAKRLTKPFDCYLPEKWSDSEAHPHIVVISCSVEMRKAPYMSRYVVQQIATISADDVKESHEKSYPTVLIIAPRPFLQSTYELIKETYPQAELRMSSQLEVDPIEGYRRLLVDSRSRLGWRILTHCFVVTDFEELMRRVLVDGAELADVLPEAYRREHVDIASLLRRLIQGETLNATEEKQLEDKLSRPIDRIRAQVSPEAEESAVAVPQDKPTIICTTLVGAKGLSAGYVFVVGMMDGHFPRDPLAVSDDEVCSFIVALSRTRKECHLVWCRMYAGVVKSPSVFLRWIRQPTELRRISKSSWS